MSLDLDWSLLDSALAEGLLAKLNNSLSKASRPNFIGPIKLTSLDFGNDAPEVRLTHLGDVWREFVDASTTPATTAAAANARADVDHTTLRHSANQAGSSSRGLTTPEEEAGDVTAPGEAGYGDNHAHMLSGDMPMGPEGRRPKSQYPSDHLTRLTERALPFTGPGVVGPRLQTFRQYTPSDIQQVHGGGSVTSFPASIPQWAVGSASVSGSGLTTPGWGAGLGVRGLMPSVHASPHYQNGRHTSPSGYFSPWQQGQGQGGPSSTTPLSYGSRPAFGHRSSQSFAALTHADGRRSPTPAFSGDDRDANGVGDHAESSTAVPSLQMHFSVLWLTNTIKLGIDTSLLINHPTPAFMELPLHVSVIGLGVQAGVVVAFEDCGEKGRKVHISLVDYEEEEEQQQQQQQQQQQGEEGIDSPEADSSGDANVTMKPPLTSSPSALRTAFGVPQPSGARSQSMAKASSNSGSIHSAKGTPRHGSMPPPQRPPTMGERLLPHITLESSVGQVDKHVLRNVGKVEKFLVEMIRTAVEDELVWPNFYTVALPPSS